MRASHVAIGLQAQAQRTPDRIAVRDASGACTFAELDGLVGTLARRLLEVDPGGGRVVPVLVGRDRWSVVALHAGFRAGVPCSPIDAGLPVGVIATLCARLGRPSTAVVAAPEAIAALPSGTVGIVVPRGVDDPVEPQVTDPATPGVIVFTSGSTGHPKGVVLDWSLFDGHPAHYLTTRTPGEAAARIGVVGPLHWIVGLRRVLAVGGGASISVLNRPTVDPVDLLAWLDAEGVTQFGLGPALAARLVGVWPDGRRLERVDLIVLGGDAATADHVRILRRLGGPAATIRYGFGATETAGTTMLHRSFAPGEDLPTGPLALGPVPESGPVRLAPVGGPGGLAELVAVGTVARGYLDDPDLTAERFGVDPDGTRWWRTGDLVRRDPDGVLRPAGRVDDTVTINGRLVAPAEAETALRDLDGVRQVAVVAHRGSRRTSLVAHLVVDPAADLTPSDVRAFCGARLAPHLVPGLLVRLEHLPVLPSGKVDRTALATAPVHPWRSGEPTPPPTDLDRWLLAEVRRVLELDDVAVNDDLRTVGLDSLAAVDLCAAISDAGLGAVDPGRVYAAGSVTALTRVIGTPSARDDVVVAHPAGRRVPIVAVPGGGGTSVRFRFLVDALGDDQPFLVVEPRGLHRRGRPDRTVPDFAAHVLDASQRHLVPDGPVVVLGYSASGPVAFEVALRWHTAGRAVHLVLLDSAPTLAGQWVVDPGSTTVRTARPAQLPLAVARSAAYRIRRLPSMLRRWRHERRPTPVRFDVERYLAFQRNLVRAARAYRPSPAPFGATLMLVGTPALADACRRSITDLAVIPVEGDHGSMLEPPHVGGLAAAIRTATDAAFRGSVQ